MKYKFIASDFDGTLANSKDEITNETRKAIADYRAAGGIFCISTGRTLSSTVQRLAEAGLENVKNVPIITFQGALAVDIYDGKILYKKHMDKKLVYDIVRYAEENNYYAHVYSDKNIFVKEDCDLIKKYASFAKVEKDVLIVGTLSEFVEKSNTEFLKVLFLDFERDMDAMSNELNAAFKGKVTFTRSNVFMVECVDEYAGKGNALKTVAKHYGIDIDETIAIGDSMNDYTMIEAAGLGVAVSNADEKLKAAAKMIGKSNDENAVADIVYKAIDNVL